MFNKRFIFWWFCLILPPAVILEWCFWVWFVYSVVGHVVSSLWMHSPWLDTSCWRGEVWFCSSRAAPPGNLVQIYPAPHTSVYPSPQRPCLVEVLTKWLTLLCPELHTTLDWLPESVLDCIFRQQTGPWFPQVGESSAHTPDPQGSVMGFCLSHLHRR